MTVEGLSLGLAFPSVTYSWVTRTTTHVSEQMLVSLWLEFGLVSLVSSLEYLSSRQVFASLLVLHQVSAWPALQLGEKVSLHHSN
jgi:hypothetical protein